MAPILLKPETNKFKMESNKKPQVVLIGLIGHGKTTIFNKCCNSNQLITAGGDSATRQVYIGDSAYGIGFKMIDTPGLGSLTDKLSHVAGIAVALSEGPVHQIIIVIKLDRTDTMLTHLKQMINYQFRKFKDIITIAVTHWDTVTQDTFFIINIKIQYWIQICSMIDQTILKSQLIKGRDCYLTEGEIQSFFDLIDINDEAEMLLIEAKNKIIKSFRKIGCEAKKFINSFNDKDPNLADIMHCLTIDFKDEATREVERFEKNNRTLFEELYKQIEEDSVFIVYAQLKQELQLEVEAVIQLAQKKMRLDDRHCYNWIRKCPYCETIWIRVQDCDGQTTCGNFPNKDEHFNQQSSFRKYKFQFNENEVMYNQVQVIKQIQKTYQLQQGVKYVGCGKLIVWKEMPYLQEQELQELYDCGVIDYLRSVNQSRLFEQRSLEQKIIDEMQKTIIVYV